jgi:3-dehydroquinate synthase
MEKTSRIRISLLKLFNSSYDISIGKDIFSSIADEVASINPDKVAIITDSNVKKLYGETLLSIIKEKQINVILLSFPSGEENKTRKTKEKIEDILIEKEFTRKSMIIALGGGIVGDVSGFIASTYMRGIQYLQVPTTLLAMVDSSIGGKTGVNTPGKKNVIGTFCQPKKVFIDIDTLKSLPREEIFNGVAEILKHGIILDRSLFNYVTANIEDVFSLNETVIEKCINQSLRIKKKVVQKDETEEKYRKILNFGHTIGHAIESASDYGISHGNAIAAGMIIETKIAKELGMIKEKDTEVIISGLIKAGFSDKQPVEKGKIIKNTHHDKKNYGDKVRYVLPRNIGNMDIDVVVEDEVVAKVLGEAN